MAIVKPFKCVRPNEKVVDRVAALPYDVYNREEAKIEVEREPLSFLKIDRAETQFPDTVGTYDKIVYEKARQLLESMIEDGTFIEDSEKSYFIYELTMDGRSQTGIVACASVDDYEKNVIKKHENTREDKEIDRINHVDICNAQTGPIFLAYRSNEIINNIVTKTKEEKPIYDFTSLDSIRHRVWKISREDMVSRIEEAFGTIREIYIADGHHRSASAVKVGLKRRANNKNHRGDEDYNFFLSVLFPHDQLMIMSYNRAVKDLNGLTKEELIEKIKENFTIKLLGESPYNPDNKGKFGMYIDKEWYMLQAKEDILSNDSVKGLDVSLLQDYLLEPILGIKDPRTDNRIDFIGGIRGLSELERRVSKDMTLAFSMYPTSITELFDVSDEDKLMPPKSTWFEPKLRSGIFIHKI